jgi:hypothetical protein
MFLFSSREASFRFGCAFAGNFVSFVWEQQEQKPKKKKEQSKRRAKECDVFLMIFPEKNKSD